MTYATLTTEACPHSRAVNERFESVTPKIACAVCVDEAFAEARREMRERCRRRLDDLGYINAAGIVRDLVPLAAPTETHASARPWTFEETVAACKNIGYDLSCGACAELFSTGVRLNEHDAGCATVRTNRGAVVVIETHASDGDKK